MGGLSGEEVKGWEGMIDIIDIHDIVHDGMDPRGRDEMRFGF